MRLRNISKSKYEFSDVNEKNGKMVVTSVAPGAELEVLDSHPEKVKQLHVQYPKDWVMVEERKLSSAELKAELAKREAEEAAEKKKADAAAKAAKAEADAAAKKKAEEDAAAAGAAK